MFKRILVPLDGSALAERALGIAFNLAHRFGSELLLLRVVMAEERLVALSPIGPQAYDIPSADLRRAEEEAWAYLNSLRMEWSDPEVPVSAEVLPGNPAEMIVAQAKLEGVDLIVMSTHGRSGMSRLIYGSVAEAVLRGARLPVLLVPARQ